MGRTVVADDRVQHCITHLYSVNQWTVGFIIGQQTVQKDYVIHLMKTPLADDDEAASGDASKHNTKPSGLASLDDVWMTSHAKQAVRMLPGGMDIIGVFACAQPDMMKTGQPKLKQMMSAVEKVLRKNYEVVDCEVNECVTERILLQICPVTRKLTCRTYDVMNSMSGEKPAEFKIQPILDQWIQLQTSISIEEVFCIPARLMSSDDHRSNISKQIFNGITPLCQNIQNSMSTIDREMLDPEAQLQPSQSSRSTGKKGKKHRASELSSEQSTPHDVDIYAPMVSGSKTDGKPIVTECGARMWLRGKMQCRAYVHPRATVKESTQAMKTDLIRSLISRIQLLCEDMLPTEEEQDPSVMYEMPLRVFGRISDSPLTLCDYMFPDESPTDSIDRFQELVDLQLTEDDLDLNSERFPTEDELLRPMQSVVPEVGEEAQKTNIPVLKYLGIMMSGAVAVIAAGISYLYITDDYIP